MMGTRSQAPLLRGAGAAVLALFLLMLHAQHSSAIDTHLPVGEAAVGKTGAMRIARGRRTAVLANACPSLPSPYTTRSRTSSGRARQAPHCKSPASPRHPGIALYRPGGVGQHKAMGWRQPGDAAARAAASAGGWWLVEADGTTTQLEFPVQVPGWLAGAAEAQLARVLGVCVFAWGRDSEGSAYRGAR